LELLFAELFEPPLEEDLLPPLDADFLAAPLLAVFLAADFLAAPLEAVFLAADFFAAPLVAVFLAADFFAAPLDEDLLPPFEELFEPPLADDFDAAFFAVAMVFEFNG
jgi:hypothetical protein